MSWFPTHPTLGELKDDISSMIGMKEIKKQLRAIVDKISIAERQACFGSTIVPPKPFHMAFIGNSGTGKSSIARILGKLFYLAGALPSYSIIEMQGQRARINQAKGGILLVNVDEKELDFQVLQEIVAIMESGETAVIFAGMRNSLNHCMHINRNIYINISVALHFNDLSCEELAMMFLRKLYTDSSTEANYDNSAMATTCKLHSSCSVGTIGKMIERETIGKLRSQLNGHLIEPMIQESKKSLALRLTFDATNEDPTTITVADLEAGISNLAKIYTKIVLHLG